MDYRTRIKAGNKNYIYADQLKFFLNRSSEEKTKQDLEYFVEIWAMYNAINDLWEKNDSVAELRWDHEEGIAVFVFPKIGEVMTELSKKGFNLNE
jgi:hypothetical protein|tara:strand:- start:1996 stop:2280 length:285 start_codon:yes stop_codon:yes gene_type:complete